MPKRMDRSLKVRKIIDSTDDFLKHVDGFWYGFKKLMIFTNSIFKTNIHPYEVYKSHAYRLICNQAFNSGLLMDGCQLEDLNKQIDSLLEEEA